MENNNFSQVKNAVIRNILQTAKKNKIKVKQVDPNFLTFALEYKNKRHYIFSKKIGINLGNASLISNKFLTNKILKNIGISAPKSFLCQNVAEVKKLLKQKKINFPFVVKPFDYSMGIGVTANITDLNMLEFAFSRINKYWQKMKTKKAKKRLFIVEEHINGNDYRILVLKNKVIAGTCRAFPEIIGNGKDNIKQLIIKYYQSLEYFKKKNKEAVFDRELLRNLKSQKVELNQILAKGKKIRLRQTANIFGGGIAINVTDKIHPFYKKIALKAAKELELNITGVDLMTEDISKKGPYAIIEMNSFPSLSMHENPDVGKPVPVTKLLLKSIFPKLK